MTDPYDDLPDAVLVVLPDGRLHQANAAARQLLGAAADPGTPITTLAGLQDGDGQDWWTCLRAADGLSSRTAVPERLLTVTRGSWTGRQVALTARLVRDDDRALRHVVVALRAMQAQERAERDQADLVSTVAHELRSPLTSIKGFTAILLAKWDRFTDEQKQLMLTMVNSDADRVTRLISELLDVSRIEAGRLELHRQVVDLVAISERVIAGQVAAGEDPGRFRLDSHGGLPEMWADPDKMVQVIGNLVENAVRHGDGQVCVTVTPDAKEPGAVVSVADEGAGVPADLAPRLFRRFARGQQRASTGLGLFICRGIVVAHGGTIDVMRAASGGAEFRFRLPAGTPSFG